MVVIIHVRTLYVSTHMYTVHAYIMCITSITSKLLFFIHLYGVLYTLYVTRHAKD